MFGCGHATMRWLLCGPPKDSIPHLLRSFMKPPSCVVVGIPWRMDPSIGIRCSNFPSSFTPFDNGLTTAGDIVRKIHTSGLAQSCCRTTRGCFAVKTNRKILCRSPLAFRIHRQGIKLKSKPIVVSSQSRYRQRAPDVAPASMEASYCSPLLPHVFATIFIVKRQSAALTYTMSKWK